jgi:hypothetical protein
LVDFHNNEKDCAREFARAGALPVVQMLISRQTRMATAVIPHPNQGHRTRPFVNLLTFDNYARLDL